MPLASLVFQTTHIHQVCHQFPAFQKVEWLIIEMAGTSDSINDNKRT